MAYEHATIILLAGEDPVEWRAVTEGYFARFTPTDDHQISLVMEMVQCSLNLNRSRRIEASLLASGREGKDFKLLRVKWPLEKHKDEMALKDAGPDATAPLDKTSIPDGAGVIAEVDTSLSSESAVNVTQMNVTESAMLEAFARVSPKTRRLLPFAEVSY